MAVLTIDHSFDQVSQAHAYSLVGVAADANEIYAAAFVQQTAAGYAVMVGDSGGLAVGPVIGVNERNVPDQTGQANGNATSRVYAGLFKRPIATSNPVTDADMLKPVYAANNHDVTSDSSKPLLGILVGIDNDAGLCTVLVGALAAATARGLTKLAEKTFTSADLTTAGVGPQHINIGSPLADTDVVAFARAKLVDAFENGSGVSLTVTVGHDNDRDAYHTGLDAFTGSALEGAGWSGDPTAGKLAPTVDGTSTGQLSASFTAGADQLDNFTNGELVVEIWGFRLP